jgi:hypothetical protein
MKNTETRAKDETVNDKEEDIKTITVDDIIKILISESKKVHSIANPYHGLPKTDYDEIIPGFYLGNRSFKTSFYFNLKFD